MMWMPIGLRISFLYEMYASSSFVICSLVDHLWQRFLPLIVLIVVQLEKLVLQLPPFYLNLLEFGYSQILLLLLALLFVFRPCLSVLNIRNATFNITFPPIDDKKKYTTRKMDKLYAIIRPFQRVY